MTMINLPVFQPVANPESVVILYHANCPDGFGAAFAAWKVYGDSAAYVPYHHGDAPIDVCGKNVVMVDCCYHKDDACQVHRNAESFLTLDHHHTSKEECGDLSFCHFDMNRSGMGMAWDYFHAGVVRPPLVTHVEARDLWRWDHRDTRAFCLKLDTLPRDFESWNYVAEMTGSELHNFLEQGRAMVAQADAMVDKFCEDARKVDFLGYRVWLLNVPRPFATDDCGAKLAARDDTDFSLMWNTPDLTDVRLSFRSANGFDVSKVAKSLGGGGHKAASGATVTLDKFKTMLTFM